MIGMGRKKSLTYSPYTHLPKEEGVVFRGCFSPFYIFFKCRNTEGKVQIHTHQQQLISKASSESFL